MYSKIYNDIYFDTILEKLSQFVPEFELEDSLQYPVLSDFFQFIIGNVDNKVILQKCFDFINDAILNGGDATEGVIVMQVFQNLYYKNEYRTMARPYLNEKSLMVFDKFYELYLKDYEPLD
jgi:hypothetical protein